MLHFELISNGRAVNAELYCRQLDRVYDKPKEKYPTLVRLRRTLFQQDNAKLHTAKKTKEKFDQLEEVEALPHPAYSLDAAPSNYGLFRPMEHFFVVADSNHLIMLSKGTRSSSNRSRQNGTSIKSECLQIGGKRLLKTLTFTLKNICYCS